MPLNTSFATLWLLFLCFVPFGSEAQNDYFYTRLSDNGMETIVLVDSSANKVHCSLCFKVGAMVETAEMNGASWLLRELVVDNFKTIIPGLKRPISIESTGGVELSCFKAQVSSIMFPTLLQQMKLMIDSVNIDSLAIERKKSDLISYLETRETQIKNRIEDQLNQLLWHSDVSRKSVYADKEAIQALQVKDIRFIQRSFYLPNNALLILSGKLEPRRTEREAWSIFKTWKSSGIEVFRLHRIPQFKDVSINSQAVFPPFNDSISRFFVAYQGPEFGADKINALTAELFSVLINNRLSAHAVTQLSYDSARLNYTAGRMASSLVFEFVVNAASFKKSVNQALNWLNEIAEAVSFSEKEMAEAKQKLRQTYLRKISSAESRAHEIETFWSYNSSDDLKEYIDSVEIISKNDLDFFVRKHLRSTHRGLVFSTNVSSDTSVGHRDAFWSHVDDSTALRTLQFKEASPLIEEESNEEVLKSLLRYMQLNPDYHVQVNGAADKSEYLRVENDEMLKFLDERARFKVVSNDIFKFKTIRLDMMRALQVIKFLVDNGIAEERLSGTSIILKSESKEDRERHRTVSFTARRAKRN